MAGDWIKIRKSLPTDPAVIATAAKIGIDEDAVVGKLVRLWAWADEHLIDGHAPSVTTSWIDRHVGIVGFARALVDAGWLESDGDGVAFPKFGRHMSETAKKRALETDRKRSSRSRKEDRHADSVTSVPKKSRSRRDKSVTREEKRREEKTSPLASARDARAHDAGPTSEEAPAEPTPEPAESSPAGKVAYALTCTPWRFGRDKAESIVARGLTPEGLVEWESFAQSHGRKAAVWAIQRYASPAEIPPDPAATPPPKDPVGERRAAGKGPW